MKRFNFLLAVVALFSMLAVSCKTEEPAAKAVMVDPTLLEFDGQDAPEQYATVYADGEWYCCDYPEWITVNPASGNGKVEVTISVTDNILEGALDNPRKAEITFRGSTLESCSYVTVKQAGDKLRGLEPTALSDVAALENETFLKIEGAQVVALAADGFIASDGTANVYVQYTKPVELGDIVNFFGEKADLKGLPLINKVENLTLVESKTPTYPEVNDITASFDAYASTTIDYITIAGVLEGESLKIEGAVTNKCLIAAPHASVDVAALNGHKVVINAYHVGTVGTTVYILPVAPIKDNGLDRLIYFSDNFDWIAPYAEASGAEDAITKPDTKDKSTSPNVYSSIPEFVSEFTERGYVDLLNTADPTLQAMYIQKSYIKLGKGKHTNGIKLPALTAMQAADNIDVAFDWYPWTGGTGKTDAVELVVSIEGNGTFADGKKESTPIPYGQDAWTWKSSLVQIVGADNTTVIVIKPSKYTGVKDGSSTYYRWCIDNIMITPAEGEILPPPPTPDPEPEPDPEPTPDPAPAPGTFDVRWILNASTMADYSTLFSSQDKAAGDGGQYVPATYGQGRLTYVQVDKTDLDAEDKASRVIGGTGEPYVTGPWLGDYFLFTADDSSVHNAGTEVHISFKTRTSKTGPRFWMLEYKEGETWVPVMPVEKTTVGGQEYEHNIVMANDGKTLIAVNSKIAITNATKHFEFRVRCMTSVQSGSDTPLTQPNGGTMRIAGGTDPITETPRIWIE